MSNLFLSQVDALCRLLDAGRTIAERKRMLRGHLLPFFLTFSHRFTATGYIRDLLPGYATDPLYWIAMPFVMIASGLKWFRGPLATVASATAENVEDLVARITAH